MYLIIDEQYRIYKNTILSGRIRNLAKRGELSVVRLSDMKGINTDGSWSAIQELPAGFEVDKDD